MFKRVLTAAAGIPLILFVCQSTSIWPLKAFIAILGVLCFREHLVAERKAGPQYMFVPTLFILMLAFMRIGDSPGLWQIALVGTVAHGALSIILRQALWLALPLLSVLLLQQFSLPLTGDILDFEKLSFAALLFLCLWTGDTAAMLFGRAIGKHPLAPAVSPNKTWEGSIGNIIAGALAGGAFAPLTNVVGWEFGVMFGLAVSITGQAGDLYESYWKRKKGIKDSGAILPGHGGILDRFDSLLFAAPAAALLLYFAR